MRRAIVFSLLALRAAAARGAGARLRGRLLSRPQRQPDRRLQPGRRLRHLHAHPGAAPRQAHPRQPHHRGAEHAGRGLAASSPTSLQRRAEGRLDNRHLRPRHGDGAADRRRQRRSSTRPSCLARQRHQRDQRLRHLAPAPVKTWHDISPSPSPSAAKARAPIPTSTRCC